MNSIRICRRIALSVTSPLGPRLPYPLASSATGESSAAVLDWNINATTAIVTVAKQPPAAAILSYAMVEGAVYDAVNAIDGGHQPYLAAPAADGSESKSAAAAAAAHDVLVGLFPAQAATLDTQLAASLAADPGRHRQDRRHGDRAVGRRDDDRRADERRPVRPVGRGARAPSQASGARRRRPSPVDPVSWVGNVRPFLLPRGDMFRSDGPNALTSAAYAADLNEVKSLGSATSTTRTADETDAAIWWQDHGAALWNRMLRNITVGQGLDIVERRADAWR